MFFRALNNSDLSAMITRLPGFNNQEMRLSALGMGITAVANTRGETNQNDTATAWSNSVLEKPAYGDNVSKDHAMALKGGEFVNFMPSEPSSLVDTLYSLTMRAGKNVGGGRHRDAGFGGLVNFASHLLAEVSAQKTRR